VHQSELPQPQNDEAIDVDLVQGVRNVGVARKSVMVVVQAFTEGEDRGHELIGGAVVEIEAAVAVAAVAVAEVATAPSARLADTLEGAVAKAKGYDARSAATSLWCGTGPA
jgi:hypothetical protein